MTGYMQPRVITWNDGRTFRIDKVKDLWPNHRSDRYNDVNKFRTLIPHTITKITL